MPDRPVRVRIAPSPTGDPHVGTAYQALFNSAFARRHGGAFVLRIEDTDRARSTPESERAILSSLRWLGLSWDEGPDVGGPYAPYRQSERLPIYREHVERLLAAGHAYRCFCSRERLERMREENRASKEFPGYDRLCRGLDPAEAARRAAAGEPHVVRMKVPTDGHAVMHDLLRGEIRRDWASIDDQVILKTDGFPTYHLANVVDDHLMEISHVIRGEEWINSLPKHVRLYEMFGWQPPVFCHLPLLRNADRTRSKLSKRRNPTSIEYYRRAGFLPEALLNFLGLMGWSPPDGEEKFSFDEMVRSFELERVSLGGPVFDVEKLRWLNGRYIREDHDAARLVDRLAEWALNRETFERIAPLAQPRLQTLSDWGYLTAFFFADDVPFDAEQVAIRGLDREATLELLQIASLRLDARRTWNADELDADFRRLAEATGLKLRDLTKPFYLVLTGRSAATPLFQSMEILGPDLCRVRLRRALERLGPVSAKKRKQAERRMVEIFGEPAP
ncbi:MAG: glutamate--tRNA ligase [Acidobacteriota bacterium]